MSQPPKTVLTSTLPRSLPSATPLPSSLHDALSNALLDAHAIPVIERALTQSLAEAGWIAQLRGYIEGLVRSGEVGDYEGIMGKVMEAVGASAGEAEGEKKEGELRIPEKVVKEGIRVVREELEKILVVVVDD